MSMLHQHFVTRLLLTTFYPFRKSLYIGFFNVSKYSGRYIIYMYARVEDGRRPTMNWGEDDARRMKCGELRPVRKDGETWGWGSKNTLIEWNTFVCYIFIINSLTFQFKIYDYGNESRTCPCGWEKGGPGSWLTLMGTSRHLLVSPTKQDKIIINNLINFIY